VQDVRLSTIVRYGIET